ncbi:MAG: thiol-disulfide oxidoreductase DCC family protein [Planctomycetaceae bacterium]
MSTATAPPAAFVRTPPVRDTVLYDGECRFCRGQIAILQRLDLTGRLRFTSLHDPGVPRDFPELSRDELMTEMVVVDTRGRTWRGPSAVRYLSRRLIALWPLALPLHLPGSMPLWRWLYGIVARNRYRISGGCDGGTCRLP